MRNRFLDFLLTAIIRMAVGCVAGGFVGMLAHFPQFVKGSSVNRLPWHLVQYWALGGAIILLVTIPKEHRFWRKRQ